MHRSCGARVLLLNWVTLSVLPLQVNAATIDGITPLFNACCSGSAACVSMLLEFGAKAQLGSHLPSPIHEAVKRGNVLGVMGVSKAKNNCLRNVSFVGG